MKEDGVIRDAKSEWATLVVLVHEARWLDAILRPLQKIERANSEGIESPTLYKGLFGQLGRSQVLHNSPL